MHTANWKTQPIKEVCEEIFSGGTPSTKEKEYWDGDIFWLSSGEIKSRYIYNTERKITQMGVDNSSTRLAKKGDTLVASAGQGNTRGNSAFSKVNTYINQSIIALRPNKQKIDAKFLFFNLSGRYSELRNLSDSNSSRGSLTCKIIENLPINLPPLPTQRKIAAILSAYDDLIENNTRRIKILEEMAQAIYREWFVHFRFPGHEGVRMVESELGLIPEGWEVKRLDEVAEVIDCLHGIKPTEVTNNEEKYGILLHVWNIGDNGKLDLSKKFFITEEIYRLWTKRIEVKCGDCVITNVGRIGAVAQIPFDVKAAIGRNMTAIRCKEGIITPTYLIEYLRSPYFEREKTLKQDSGTVMGSLNVKGIVRLNVPLAPFELIKKFEANVRPLRYRIEIFQKQNENLRCTRDLLLPKLISGELDVSELDITIPEENT